MSATDQTGVRGILAPVARLDRWLQFVFVVLVVTSAVRYLERHGFGADGVLVLAGAALLTVAYSLRPLLPTRSWWPTAWVVTVTVLWALLTLAAPSFAWCAVPLGFAVLQVLPFRGAVTVVVLMTAVVTAAELRIADGVDPTVIAGPIGIAVVTVLVYRALQRESAARQALLDELTDAQHELLQAQHRAGALAERQRLSREIHDSVGQRLASITLLLAATEQDWERRPDLARDHVAVAAATARDGLAEVRRVVHGLPPVDLADDASGEALPSALQRLVDESVGPGAGPEVSLHVHGDPVPLAADVAGGLLRSARGALANAIEHSGARRVAVTLTFLADEVRLDVRDDGTGFDADAVADASVPPHRGRTGRGRGLQGILDRAAGLGGRASIESSPRDGTTISIELPLEGE
ncbi:signal transduction histidine kinase [Agromyces hippuratus]|uniref:Oxygen sensor histidine kinase NreB n=1 Tax=Agromyces hippuratus TaxID=286438 RepID=A0A852WTI5_9MICO|nr:sensor histidine kinase [Agromyces hippuratus]NYG21259.1 signal transduction histidine kinase [Agromyces hippuratus]